MRIYVIFFIICAVGTAAYGAKYYYDSTQATIATLRENNAKLETANEINQVTIAKQQEDAIMLAELNNTLTRDLQRAEQYGDELRDTLQKHNLTHLANRKPGLIEQRMQNATDKLWDDLESITSPVTD